MAAGIAYSRRMDAEILHALNRLIQQQEEIQSRLHRQLQLGIYQQWQADMALPRYSDPKRLVRYGAKIYSQTDEDGIIAEIFRRIGIAHKTFVEFGVGTGEENNTVALLMQGWRGLWLDGSAEAAQRIHQQLGHYLDNKQLTFHQTFITRDNINLLIEAGGFKGDIDFLCVDIDGNDLWVWQAIDVIKPRVVALEYNGTWPPPLSVTLPYKEDFMWDATNYMGASLSALTAVSREKGYSLVGCNYGGGNAFFVRDDLLADHFVAPYTAEEHFEPLRYFFDLKPGHHNIQTGTLVSYPAESTT